MNNETYEALKRIIAFVKEEMSDIDDRYDDVRAIEMWIEEVAKEYDEVNHKCIECGKELPDSQSGYCYECCEKV